MALIAFKKIKSLVGKDSKKNKKVLMGIGLFGIVCLVIIGVFGYQAFQLASLTPSDVEREEGFCAFYFIDGESGESISGSVVLTALNDMSRSAGGPVSTGITIELAYDIENPYVATVHSVNLDVNDNRTFLPSSFMVDSTGTEKEPTTNTIIVYFLLNPANITVNITSSSPDDRLNKNYSFNHTSFNEETLYEIELNITVKMRDVNSLYGSSSFVPTWLLPQIHTNNSIDYYGLWLMFNGTEILSAEVGDQAEYSKYYYVQEWNVSIILLEPIFSVNDKQTVKFELKDAATAMYVFEGLLTQFSETKIQII